MSLLVFGLEAEDARVEVFALRVDVRQVAVRLGHGEGEDAAAPREGELPDALQRLERVVDAAAHCDITAPCQHLRLSRDVGAKLLTLCRLA